MFNPLSMFNTKGHIQEPIFEKGTQYKTQRLEKRLWWAQGLLLLITYQINL